MENKYSLIVEELGIKKIVFFIFLNFFVLFLELLSFSMFIPFLLALTNIEKLLNYEIFIQTLSMFHISKSDKMSILLLIFIFLITVFFLKNLFIGISNYFKFKIIFQLESKLTSIVFQKYLRKPYLFHTSENSSKAIRNIIGETAMFVRSILGSILSIIIESAVLMGIFLILFLNEPGITIKLLLCFLFLAVFFFILFNKKYVFIGKERQKQDSNRIKYVQQGIQGIKEIIAFNLQKFILTYFERSNEKVIKNTHYAGFLNTIPKLIMETLAIVIILIIFLTTQEIQNDFNKHIFVLGLISVTAFRMFPGINKILAAFNTYQYAKPTIKVLSQIFEDDVKNSKKTYNLENNKENLILKDSIQIKNLYFKYPSANDYIFENLDLRINKGEHIGIMGETGSGKSTLVDLILGIINPIEGNIYCDKKSVFENLFGWRNLIGYVTQFPYLLDDSIESNIAIGVDKDKISTPQLFKCLEIANLKNFVNSLGNKHKTLIGERGALLSGGQIQRLAIARALYKSPNILLLDEATASVDTVTEARILQDLNKYKKDLTSISISHSKEALKFCDKIYELKNNKLILK
jgi:ABC-type multidrug transport system fused ATPase/permease subunit